MADTDNIDSRKRARRRLVGAIALALLAVLVLPMIMDDEPVGYVQEIQVSIPDSEADSFRSRPIAGRLDISVEPDQSANDEDKAGVAELSAQPVVTPEAASAQPAPAAEQAVPAERPPASEAKPAPAGQGLDSEAARVKAILEGKAGPRASIGPGFMVQVGAFSEYEKAELLRSELAQKGFPVVIETAGGMSRVRVGPYSTRADAEKGEARLSAAGRAGVVIAR